MQGEIQVTEKKSSMVSSFWKRFTYNVAYILFSTARMTHRRQQNRSAFTLVELIVVITILAILGTIGFISIQGYSRSARDSSRVSDLANLAKALDVSIAAGKSAPMPDANMLTITASGTTIGYQGYAGNNVLRSLGLGGKFQDPVDGKHYTYLTNATQSKYQILSLLEGSSVTAGNMPGIPTAYASAYDTRTPSIRGSGLGILLGTGASIYQPVQELYSGSFTGVDLANTTSTYAAWLSNKDVVTGTGGTLFSGVSIRNVDLLTDKTLAASDASLVGWWDMETLTGSLLKDLSGKGNHGTCYNSASIVNCGTGGLGPQFASGDRKNSRVMSFDGVDDWISVTNAASLNPNHITIVAFFKLRTNTVQMSMLAK